MSFENLSGDPQQEYFSDGITEDIITELSRFSELAVIARNSTFQYKGKALDVRDVGRQLGVRYVLEGSIRRVDGRIRINAKLIDAVSGAHLWAERYDRELSDVFAVQDEVTRAIVTVLAGYLNLAEAERTLLKPPAAWEAYDYYLQGTRAYWLGFTESAVASTYEARRLLEKSLSIDPNYARAYAILARSYVATYLEPRDGDYLLAAGLERAHEFARKAVQLDGGLPEAHAQFGWVLLFQRQYEAAIVEYERAILLNPNFTDTSYGLCLMFAGEPKRAIDILQANLRLDPFQNASRLGYIGHAHYMLNRYTAAYRHCGNACGGCPIFASRNSGWPRLTPRPGSSRKPGPQPTRSGVSSRDLQSTDGKAPPSTGTTPTPNTCSTGCAKRDFLSPLGPGSAKTLLGADITASGRFAPED